MDEQCNLTALFTIIKLKLLFQVGPLSFLLIISVSLSFLSLLSSLFLSLLCPVVRRGPIVRVVAWWVWVRLDGSMVVGGGGGDDSWSAIVVRWAWVVGPTVQWSWWRFGDGGFFFIFFFFFFFFFFLLWFVVVVLVWRGSWVTDPGFVCVWWVLVRRDGSAGGFAGCFCSGWVVVGCDFGGWLWLYFGFFLFLFFLQGVVVATVVLWLVVVAAVVGCGWLVALGSCVVVLLLF